MRAEVDLAEHAGGVHRVAPRAHQPPLAGPPPSTVVGPDPRIGAEEHVGSRSHVPSSVTGPIECQDLMALDFKTHIFQAFAQIPSYSSWLVEADLTPTYAYERRVLKLLQWRCPPRRWSLKSPTHMLYINALNKMAGAQKVNPQSGD